jgi:hypothetical protein
MLRSRSHRAAGVQDEVGAAHGPAGDVVQRVLPEGAPAVGGEDVEAVHTDFYDNPLKGSGVLRHQADVEALSRHIHDRFLAGLKIDDLGRAVQLPSDSENEIIKN